MNLREILNVVGLLLILLSALFVVPLAAALFYAFPAFPGHLPETAALAWSALLAGVTGLLLYGVLPKGIERFHGPEGYIIVVLAWGVIAFFGALPYYLSGICTDFLDAYFESMSGFTTTGASLLGHLDSLPPALLLWRSMTQWLGGMGIIMLYLAVLHGAGAGARHLFRGEIPGGLTVDRMEARFGETARLLWKTYLMLTLFEVLLLIALHLPLYDAVCLAFSTLSTGGFAPHALNMAYYTSPAVQWTVLVFMVLAGINFLLHHQAVRGKFTPLWQNGEWRVYLGLILGVSLLVHGIRWFNTDGSNLPVFRDSAFTVVSILTTTGFTTEDYTLWPAAVAPILLVLMMIGGCSGSTAGAVKVIRIILLFKAVKRELLRMIYPQALVHIKVDEHPVDSDHVFNALCLVALFGLLAGSGFMALAAMGLDWTTALSASFACLFNVGPGMGAVGPAGGYALIPDAGTLLLTLLMLMGRLEIYGVLLLFYPLTWKK